MSTPHWRNGLRTNHRVAPDTILRIMRDPQGHIYRLETEWQLWSNGAATRHVVIDMGARDRAIEASRPDRVPVLGERIVGYVDGVPVMVTNKTSDNPAGYGDVTGERITSLYGIPVVLVEDLGIPVPHKIVLCYPTPGWFIRGTQS